MLVYLHTVLYLCNLRSRRFLFCLFVCLIFSFLLRPCNLLGYSPTKLLATHSSYYGLAGKIIYSLQISEEASIVSSLKLKSHVIYENRMHLASSSFVKGSSISISPLSSFKKSVSGTGSCKKRGKS